MKHLWIVMLWIPLITMGAGSGFFDGTSFMSEYNTYIYENSADMSKKDIANHLLDILGEHLLSKGENNLFIQIFIKNDGTIEDFRQELKHLLKPFLQYNSKLTTEIHCFIKKVLKTIRSVNMKTNFTENNIKMILPSLQIFCKQLIDCAS